MVLAGDVQLTSTPNNDVDLILPVRRLRVSRSGRKAVEPHAHRGDTKHLPVSARLVSVESTKLV